MQNGVTFWTEGGPSIGMGHVMRCINIARVLVNKSLPLHFLVNNEKPVLDRLDAEALFHLTYPINGKHARKLTNGVVVIDTKHDVSMQVRELKEEGKKVVLIDNSSSDEADTVVMPSVTYKGASDVRLLSGGEYLIIGDNFKIARHGLSRPVHSVPFKVLVTMGGSDPFGLTERVIKALKSMDCIEVTAVIGPAFRMLPSMEQLIKDCPAHFRFLFDVKNLAPLMGECHAAFTAMGTTVYELAYMGVPSILIGNYETDRNDLAALEALGICKSLGHYREVEGADIAGAIEAFKSDITGWESMSRNALSLTDGNGASRIAKIILSLLNGG